MSEDSNPSNKDHSDQPKQVDNKGKNPSDSNSAREKSKSARKSGKKSAKERNKPQDQKEDGGGKHSSDPSQKDQSTKDASESSKSGSDKDGSNPSGRRRRSRNSSRESKSPKSSSKHDSDLVAKHAWKIYLAEIGEEGVTLMDDKAAKELARRCFELAETFLNEEQKRN